jgi:hypothetical protein
VVDALGRGEQILILRKGGIHESRGGFQVDYDRFLLFPTQFHQQRASVVPAAQRRFDQLAPPAAGAGQVHIEYFAEVAAAECLDDLAAARNLRGQHIWREDVIAERFDWGKSRSIFALALRVFRLPGGLDLPLLPSYGGCKSWIELAEDVPIREARPVLDDALFSQRLDQFRSALGQARS